MNPAHPARGYTLIELLTALAIAAVLLGGLTWLTGSALNTGATGQEGQDLNRQAQAAMARIVNMVGRSPGLVVPLVDNPGTVQTENINTALAILEPRDIDLDHNGIPDADNDGDGKFDEDTSSDMNNDGKPGVAGVDDNMDGTVDNGSSSDDDEDGNSDEDKCDGIDNDGDGSVDEDCGYDMNGDFQTGLAQVDDDGDGQIDEGFTILGINLDLQDDDEDGKKDEDWLDTVVYLLDNGTLKERMPVPWDANGDGKVTGADTVSTVLASNVTQFRVERVAQGNNRLPLVDITLTLTGPKGNTVTLRTRVRVGGAL